MVIQTIRKKRPLPARQLAEMYDVTPRTIMRWAAQTRADWIDEQAAGREAIRAYHDDDGHSWTQTAKHFHLSLSTVKERAYRARQERAAEAEEKARNEVHKNEVLTSFCARLYGRRAAKHKTDAALKAARDA